MSKKLVQSILLVSLLAMGCGGKNSSGPGPWEDEPLDFLFCFVVQVESEMHVQWSANRPTQGTVEWGRQGLQESLTEPTFADSHDIRIPNLTFGTNYVYCVTARDSLTASVSYTGAFATPPKSSEAPVIFNLAIPHVTDESAQVIWETDEPATTILHYGTGTPNDSVYDATMSYQHEVILTSLESSTLYWARPEAVDEDGYRGVGTDTSFTTAARLTLWTPDTTMVLGDTIFLPVWLSNAKDIAALQYILDFGTNHLELLEFSEGPLYSNRGGFAFFQEVDPAHGRAGAHISWDIEVIGSERIGTQVDGEGVVAWLGLRGLAPGTDEPFFYPDSSFALDMLSVVLSCSLRAGQVEVLSQE